MDPQTIASKQFAVRIRGYDPDEVDQFLDQVEAAYREQQDSLDALLLRLDAERKKADGLHSASEQAARLLAIAQRAADEETAKATHDAAQVVAEAQREAAKIRDEARQEAARIVQEGTARKHEELGRLEDERQRLDAMIRDLTAVRDQIIAQMKTTLSSWEQA